MKEQQKMFNGDELAISVWSDKYATKEEKHYKEMHFRMAKEFSEIEKKYQKKEKFLKSSTLKMLGYSKYNSLSKYGKERKDLDYMDIYKLFKDFKYIIPQGSIMATLGTDILASLSNCWVVASPLDSYSSILKTDGELVYYYKRRGGVGVDISNLRPKDAKTNNTAKSSTGAVSFMERYSNTTREVAMAGRRGALMISISIDHPDSMDFIKIKSDKTKVTGANISVRITDEFMKAVENDEDYALRFPCDTHYYNGKENYQGSLGELSNFEYNQMYEVDQGVYVKRIKAKEYWDEIIKSARNYAEPGLMYWDNVLDNDSAGVYKQYKPVSSNPCGEQFLNPNDSCRLMAYNLFSLVKNPFTKGAFFDFEQWYKIVYEGTRLGDNLVDLEVKYINRIIDKLYADSEPFNIKKDEIDLWEKSREQCLNGRRAGMGITALGDMLAALGIKFGSEESLDIIKKIFKEKLRAELDCQIDLSKLRGPFKDYDYNKEFEITSKSFKQITDIKGKNAFFEMLAKEFPEQVKEMIRYGRRSVSWSTVAPTGSVSILTQTTSGIEPVFKAFYTRRKKVNPGEKGTRVDFVDEVGDSWQEFAVLHPKFADWLMIYSETDEQHRKDYLTSLPKESLQKAFEKSPWYGSTANDIDWKKRVEIQAILQSYTTNAISSTINLPSTVTTEEVSDIYMYGWKAGLKGQTVYVDGSRSGVLVSDNKKESNDSFDYRDAVKRPKELEAFAHRSTSKGVKYSVIVGLLDNKPYEIFITEGKAYGNGVIKKIGKGTYKFIKTDKGHEFEEDITAELTDEQAAITRLTSGMLRHGGDVKYIVEQLAKIKGDMFGFTNSLGRVLKKYISEGSSSTLSCEECGGNNVIFEEGCSKCLDCGHSACS